MVVTATALLGDVPPKPLPCPRTAASVAGELRVLADTGALDLPLPGPGGTAVRWRALAALGRRDLTLARLAEGHTDALAILAEAGRTPVPGALYGVWAARSGGTGALLRGDRLTGTVRFCSGASSLDRALVVALDEDGRAVTVEVDLAGPGLRRHPDSWPGIGMDASDSLDVTFEPDSGGGAPVGPPGFYLQRPGFALGGAGVAAVWLGGCAGVLDTVLAALREHPDPDPHQCAELGALHAAVQAAEGALLAAADRIDAGTGPEVTALAGTVRAVLERTGREVLDRAPRAVGATPLSRDHRFAQQLTDLTVYLRQHHGARDLAALGTILLAP